MPQARAAASFEPSAKTRRPKTVLRKHDRHQDREQDREPDAGREQQPWRIGNVTASSLTHVGGTLTVCWSASHFATPRAMPSMPSVAMNGTTRSRVMATPLINPIDATRDDAGDDGDDR